MGGIAVRCGRLGEWGKRRPNDGGCAVSGGWTVAVTCGVAVRCGRVCGGERGVDCRCDMRCRGAVICGVAVRCGRIGGWGKREGVREGDELLGVVMVDLIICLKATFFFLKPLKRTWGWAGGWAGGWRCRWRGPGRSARTGWTAVGTRLGEVRCVLINPLHFY